MRIPEPKKKEMRAEHTKRSGKGAPERGFREASCINSDHVWATHKRSDPHNWWSVSPSPRCDADDTR